MPVTFPAVPMSPLRMHKALTEMNVQIHRVLSDITGHAGLAISEGERDGLSSPE
jgi:hypothetical protein